jgi:type 1 glutamine amidotransferase
MRNIALKLCLLSALAFIFAGAVLGEEKPKKIVLIAGKKSHGPVGNGIHDYGWNARLIKVMLDNSNVADEVAVEYHLNGWPEDQSTLKDADTIMIISDGRDGGKFKEALHLDGKERVKFVEEQMKRGCGLVVFHFSTFGPDKYADRMLRWYGAYFDWETDGKRDWYSAIKTLEAQVEISNSDHALSRGVEPFTMKEEFYYNLRFDPDDDRMVPLWKIPALEGRKPHGNVVTWARRRKNGGRGFGTTCGHWFDRWQIDSFRTGILNGLVWTAKMKIPEGGVRTEFYRREQIKKALKGVEGTERAVVGSS